MNRESTENKYPEPVIIWKEYLSSYGVSVEAIEFVDRLLDEAIAEEREACAKVVDNLKEEGHSESWWQGCDVAAAAIRARKTPTFG